MRIIMAAKRPSSSRPAVSRNGRRTIDWRSRLHKPVETDPKKRAEMIDRATSRIKTTARIDTITLGRD
jgi:hypothetical protein